MNAQAPLSTDDERRAAMAMIARAEPALLRAAHDGCPDLPEMTVLRRPEVGSIMVRGRIGGSGDPFNLGEATASRAAVRLATGETGFACVLGRDPERALLAAAIDALWQSPAHHAFVETAVVAPTRVRLEAESDARRRRAGATRVEFFTMVRGE